MSSLPPSYDVFDLDAGSALAVIEKNNCDKIEDRRPRYAIKFLTESIELPIDHMNFDFWQLIDDLWPDVDDLSDCDERNNAVLSAYDYKLRGRLPIIAQHFGPLVLQMYNIVNSNSHNDDDDDDDDVETLRKKRRKLTHVNNTAAKETTRWLKATVTAADDEESTMMTVFVKRSSDLVKQDKSFFAGIRMRFHLEGFLLIQCIDAKTWTKLQTWLNTCSKFVEILCAHMNIFISLKDEYLRAIKRHLGYIKLYYLHLISTAFTDLTPHFFTCIECTCDFTSTLILNSQSGDETDNNNNNNNNSLPIVSAQCILIHYLAFIRFNYHVTLAFDHLVELLLQINELHEKKHSINLLVRHVSMTMILKDIFNNNNSQNLDTVLFTRTSSSSPSRYCLTLYIANDLTTTTTRTANSDCEENEKIISLARQLALDLPTKQFYSFLKRHGQI